MIWLATLAGALVVFASALIAAELMGWIDYTEPTDKD